MVNNIAKNFMSLPAEDRIGMLSDTYALAKAGHAEPEAIARLLSGCAADRNVNTWAETSALLQGLNKAIKSGGFGDAVETAYNNFASRVLAPCAKEVGWEVQPGDDDNKKRLRQTMISCLGKFSGTDPEVWAAAKPKYEAFLANPDTQEVSADIRNAVLCIAAKNEDGEKVFAAFKEAHNKTGDDAVKRDIYSGLGSIPDLALKRRFLDWSLTPDIKPQDMAWPLMEVVTSSLQGAEVGFKWIEESYDIPNGIDAQLGKTSQIIFNLLVR